MTLTMQFSCNLISLLKILQIKVNFKTLFLPGPCSLPCCLDASAGRRDSGGVLSKNILNILKKSNNDGEIKNRLHLNKTFKAMYQEKCET